MGRKRTTQKSLRRGLIEEIYNSAPMPQPAQPDYTPSFNSGMSRDEIANIYNSYTPETQEIPTLKPNTTPTTPSISDELERMKKAKADTTTPRTPGEQKAIDTYYDSLVKASGQTPTTSVPKTDYKAEIERMNAIKADTTTPRTEGENKAIETYLNSLVDAQRYMDSQKPRKSKKIGTVEVKADGTKTYTKAMSKDEQKNYEDELRKQAMIERGKEIGKLSLDAAKAGKIKSGRALSANEQRDVERAIEAVNKGQAKAVGKWAKDNATPRERALSPNEQRDLERAQEAQIKAKEKQQEAYTQTMKAADTYANNAPENSLAVKTIAKNETPQPTPTAQNLLGAYADTLVQNGKTQEAANFVNDVNKTLQTQYDNQLAEYERWNRTPEQVMRDYGVSDYDDKGFQKNGESFKDLMEHYRGYDVASLTGTLGAQVVADKEKKKLKDEIQTKYGISDEQFKNLYAEYEYALQNQIGAEKAEQALTYGQEHPVLGSVASVGQGMFGALNSVPQLGYDLASGREKVSPYEGSHLYSQLKDASREGVTTNISPDWGKVAYNYGMGGVDMLANTIPSVVTGGAVSPAALMALQTANDSSTRALSNGADADKAAITGLINGAIDYGLNSQGIDSLKGINASNSWYSNAARGALVEGLVNDFQERADIQLDRLINQENAEYNIVYNNAIANGASPEEAKNIADSYKNQRARGAFVGGATFGAVFGGIEGAKAKRLEQNVKLPDYMEFAKDRDSINIDGLDYAIDKNKFNLVDADGNEVPIIDPSIFDTSNRGTEAQTKREFASKLTNYIKKNFLNKSFVIKDNGHTVGFIDRSAKEFAGSRSSMRKNNENMGLKANIAPRLQTVIENALFSHHEDNVKTDVPIKARGIDKYDVSIAYPTKDGVKIYDAVMDVGLHKDGNEYFYDILGIKPKNKKKADPRLLSDDSVTNLGRPSFDNSVALSKEAVNPDDVIYHSGVLSRLNKADSAGKMEGSRDTGYFGTGHYFVDQAHKNQIGKGTGYGDKPYTSVDISRYGNLFKADTDAKADKLHDFSQRMMRYINKHNDKYYTDSEGINADSLKEYMDDMYSQYRDLFGNNALDRNAFEARLNDFRNNYRYDFYDRGDSAFTTFMKEHGYNGVDTRGTRSADVERGVVIYDLDENSVLQSNVTDEATKNGLMNTRVRNGNPIFDADTDARIQKEIDAFNRNEAVRQEYRRIYDDTKLRNAEDEVDRIEKRLDSLENDTRSYYYSLLNDENYLNREARQHVRDFEELGLDTDIESEKQVLLDSAKEGLAEVDEQIKSLNADLERAKANLEAEEKLSDEAYKQAQEIIANKGKTPTPVNVPPDDNEGMRERGFSRHIRGEDTPMKVKDVPDEVADYFRKNPDMYKPLKNKDTAALADNIYNSGNDPIEINGKTYSGDVETKWRKLLSEKNPASLPLGCQIARDYSASGNHEMAAQIYRDMDAGLTESGQFSQAAIISMMKNDPLTALAYFERTVDKMNQEGAERYGKKWSDFVLTDEERALFDNIEPGDSEAIKAAYDKIGHRIEKEYPASTLEKILEFRRVAMLFNLRTIDRNFLANPPTAGLRYVADRIEAIGQNIGHLINPEIEITQAVRGSNAETRALAVEAYNDPKIQAMIKDTPGRLSEIPKAGDYAKSKQIFKGTRLDKWINELTNGGIEKLNAKLGKENAESALELWRNSAYGALEITDNPFVRENFVSRLGSYIRAKGITDISQIPDDAITMAIDEAMKATYKDNSWLVKAIKKFKGGIEEVGNHIHPGLGDIASQALIPYVQAPGNIGARVVDYSPLGLAKGIGKIIGGNVKGNVKLIQKGIEEASKGLSGSLLTGLGMALYKAGVLTGSYSDDPDEKAWQKSHGFREHAIRYTVNGKTRYDTIDWAQPIYNVILRGVLLQQAIDNSDQYDSDILRYFGYEGTTAGKLIGTARESLRGGVNAYFNATPLKNFGDLFRSNYSGDVDIAENIWNNTIEDFATGMTPAQLNALAKTVDPIQRQTYNPDNTFGTFVNTVKSRIPGLSDNLAPQYDTLGRVKTYGDNWVEAGIAKNFIPGEHTTDRMEDIDREIERLASIDKSAYPLVAPNSVNGEKLNDIEIANYQHDMGERTRLIVDSLIKSEMYSNLDDAQKIVLLGNIYGTSKAITERDMFGKAVADNSTYKNYIAAYDEGNVKGLLNFIQAEGYAKGSGASTSSNAYDTIVTTALSGDTEKADMLEAGVNALIENGVPTAGQSTYTDRGSVHYPDGNEYASMWNEANSNGNTSISQEELVPYLYKLKKEGKLKTDEDALVVWESLLTNYTPGTSKIPVWDEKSNSYKPTKPGSNFKSTIPEVEAQPTPSPTPTPSTNTIPSPTPIPTVNPGNYTRDDAVSQLNASISNNKFLGDAWDKAILADPSMTPDRFISDWSYIDGDGSGKYTQAEFVTGMNNLGLDEEAGKQFIKTYYNSRWTQPKYSTKGNWYIP